MPRVINSAHIDAARRLGLILTRTVAAGFRVAHEGRQKPRNIERLRQVHTTWAAGLLSALGMGIEVSGEPLSETPTLFVSNHVSYLDIIVLKQVIDPRNLTCFVSKKEVAAWPVFGAAATAAETIYVDRKLSGTGVDVRGQIAAQIKDRFARGYSVVIFPEGTSTIEVAPFKRGPFITAVEQDLLVQPVTIGYRPLRPCAYIDDDTLMPHLWALLHRRELTALVHFHKARRVSDASTAAQDIHAEVRAQMEIWKELQTKNA